MVASYVECGQSREVINNLPTLEISVYYKNVLNGYFKALYEYRIYPFDEDDNTMKKWLRNIKMFNVDFSDGIKRYNSLQKINPKDADIIFNEIKSKFEKDVQGSNLEMDLHLIPGSFYVKPISDKEYLSEIDTKSIWYGTYLGIEKKDWLEMKTNDTKV